MVSKRAMFSGAKRARGTAECSHTCRLNSSLLQPVDAAVAACSGPRSTSGSPPRYTLFEPTVAATLETVATMAGGVVEAWSLMLCGASDLHTVTVLSPAKPRSAASDSQGEAASFSARQ